MRGQWRLWPRVHRVLHSAFDNSPEVSQVVIPSADSSSTWLMQAIALFIHLLILYVDLMLVL